MSNMGGQSTNSKMITLLSILRRLIDEPTLLLRFQGHLHRESFTLGDNSPSDQALNRMFQLLTEGFKRHKNSIQFNMGTFSQIIKQELDEQEDSEVNEKISKFHKLVEGVGLVSDSQKAAFKEIHAAASNDTILNEMLNRIKLFEFHHWHEKQLKQLIKKGDINTAMNAMHVLTEDLKDLELHTSKPFDFDNLEKLIDQSVTQDHGDMKNYMQFGLKEIDDELVGGFYRQTLNGFMAVSGGGKSQMCTHLIAQCVRQKLRVHVVSVEEEDRLFATRLVAAVSGVESKSILHGVKGLSPKDKIEYDKAVEAIKKYVILEFIYDKGLEEIHRIKRECFEGISRRQQEAKYSGGISTEEEVVVDIVDYSGHLAGQASGDKMHEKMLEVYKMRKNFALKHKLIAFDFIQPNRDGTKKENDSGVLRSTDIAGGFDMIRVFDNLISINRGPRDIETKSARLYVDKSRSGDLKGKTWQVNTEFNKGRFDTSNPIEIGSLLSVSSAGGRSE